MNTSAMVTMVVTMSIVTAFTVYYFVKVLRTPDKDPEDFPPGP